VWRELWSCEAGTVPLVEAATDLVGTGLMDAQLHKVLDAAQLFQLAAFDAFMRAVAAGLKNCEQPPSDEVLNEVLRRAATLACLKLGAANMP
jgi:hypothetical protein